jgi:hypothetical protein
MLDILIVVLTAAIVWGLLTNNARKRTKRKQMTIKILYAKIEGECLKRLENQINELECSVRL